MGDIPNLRKMWRGLGWKWTTLSSTQYPWGMVENLGWPWGGFLYRGSGGKKIYLDCIEFTPYLWGRRAGMCGII
jgi:hypothetical protein